jgi:hypothetical protein
MDLENGQGERVERKDVLCVLGLAVRLDDLAVDDDTRRFDLKRSRVKASALRAAARRAAKGR